MAKLITSFFYFSILLAKLIVEGLPTKSDDQILQECLEECGVRSSFFGERSMGGHPIKDFPFSGQLRMNVTGCTFESRCSAIIVDKNYVLSASHCLNYDLDTAFEKCRSLSFAKKENVDKDNHAKLVFHPANIRFVAQTNVSIESPENVYQIAEVFRIKIKGEATDIMLLKLKRPIEWTLNKRAACLYQGFVPEVGNKLTFVGYGQVPKVENDRWAMAGDNFIPTNYAHEAFLSVQSRSHCELHYGGRAQSGICVGSNGVGLAHEDSGGAEFIDHEGRLFVVGIASKAGALSDKVNEDTIRRDLHPDYLVQISPAICNELKRRSKNSITCHTSLVPPTQTCKSRLLKEQYLVWEESGKLIGDEAMSAIADQSYGKLQQIEQNSRLKKLNTSICTKLGLASCVPTSPICDQYCLSNDHVFHYDSNIRLVKTFGTCLPYWRYVVGGVAVRSPFGNESEERPINYWLEDGEPCGRKVVGTCFGRVCVQKKSLDQF